MLITKFSKDGKRGFSVGSNKPSNEDVAAGMITLAAGLLMAGIGGLFKIKKKPVKSSRAKGEAKKKNPIWLALLPFVFRTAKSNIKNNFLDNLAKQAEKTNEQLEALGDSVEIINAIPISSEKEVYDHI